MQHLKEKEPKEVSRARHSRETDLIKGAAEHRAEPHVSVKIGPASKPTEIIRFDNVHKQYGNDVSALSGISFSVESGEFVFLCGPSGAGKSTIVKLLTCETRPTSGNVTINGYDINTVKQSQIPYLRRTVGVVFQDFRLIQRKNVYENVAFAMKVVGTPKRVVHRRVRYVLELVGLLEKARSKPAELSGGEKQRVAIARALVNNPSMIIADEPTGNLDPQRSYETMMLLKQVNELGTTVLVVTHEKELVNMLDKRVIYIDGGCIVRDRTGGYGK